MADPPLSDAETLPLPAAAPRSASLRPPPGGPPPCRRRDAPPPRRPPSVGLHSPAMAEAVAPAHPRSLVEGPRRLVRHARQGLDDLGPPRVVLGMAIALFTMVFGRLVYQRHDRFGSFDFDLG